MKKLLFIALAFSFFSCKAQKQFAIFDYIAEIESTSILEYKDYYIGPLGRGSRTRLLGYPGRCNVLFTHRNGKNLSYGIMNNRTEKCIDNVYYLQDSIPITLSNLINIFNSLNIVSLSSRNGLFMLVETLISDSSYNELKNVNPDYFDLTYKSKSERFDRKYYYYNFIYIYDPENITDQLDHAFSRRTVYKINDHWYYYREIPTFFYKRF